MNLLEAYKKMILIRTSEQRIADLYLANKIMSFVHFYIGQEAVAVGVCEALTLTDRVLGNHRSHGHYLAKGGDLRRMVCELLGKEYGSSHGKGGSMHLIDKSVNFSGSTPILGSVVPLGTGSAFEQKYTGKKDITAVFFGDGASEEGVVYESVNIACLYALPILYVIENNLYSVNTKLRERRGEKYNTEQIMTGIGARYLMADGNDLEDVYSKAKELIAGLREGKGPAVLECIAYRHMAHSAPIMDDKQGYREEDTLEKRLEADPVKKIRAKLLSQGIHEDDILDIESKVNAKVAEDIIFAQEAAYPTQESLNTDLYA